MVLSRSDSGFPAAAGAFKSSHPDMLSVLKEHIEYLRDRITTDDAMKLMSKDVLTIAEYEKVTAQDKYEGRSAGVKALLDAMLTNAKTPENIRRFFEIITLPDGEKEPRFGWLIDGAGAGAAKHSAV